MFDWDEGDRFSFEDSDRFDEDSLCSWISEPESLLNNWRGWKKQQHGNNNNNGHHYYIYGKPKVEGQVLSLVEASARVVACHIPFEVVEHVCPPVPEQLQLRIAYWSFPENEEDIRLYSCLANGSADEFQRGEHLFRARGVNDLLQIGFHLSATVVPPQTISVSKGACNVAVTFDRCRITSCNCTCTSSASWCSHVVAVCLHRIHQPTQVRLRAPVSESLSRLHRDQLQKFAQYLISELPQQQILPTAQRLLDELLSNQQTAINTLSGAPDPTAGASADAQTSWCLDEATLHENIRKILIKLCVPSPMVFSDVNYLSSTAPPAATEWSSLLRPLRGREPEGMWNLLSIVREMFRRNDRNAIPLLAILTDEVLSCDQILVWWFNTKVSLHTGSGNHFGRSVHSNTHASQHACSSLCDEIVVLWRLAALNPALSPLDRNAFFGQLHDWHLKTLDKVWKLRNNSGSGASGIRRSDIDIFTGFKPSMEACLLDWSDYPISGITFAEGGARRWYFPYFQSKPSSAEAEPLVASSSDELNHVRRTGRSIDISQAISHWGNARAILIHAVHNTHVTTVATGRQAESNRSSLSSEGFCENDNGDGSDLERLINQHAGLSSLAITKGELFGKRGDGFSLPNPGKGSTGDTGAGPSGASSSKLAKDTEGTNDSPGRPSGDSKGEASESQPSSDEYQMYYYDPQAQLPTTDKDKKDEDERFTVSVKKIDDALEVLFSRAEALHAHGYTLEACTLAVKLAEQLLVNPPNLMMEVPPPANRGKRARRFNPASHQISLLASATLAKTAFLSTVLSENLEHHHLAFRVALFGLELARPPASTKALEVKLANQEQDIVLLLKRLPLNEAELKVVKERAEQLRDGQLRSRGEALLPIMLASYIFDALALSSCNARGGQPSNKPTIDEALGFEAAVAALGLKANVSEAEHPLLCEGTRRQRGDLAINLLVHYKDDQEKLAKIMDKLLDKDMHQMYKSPALNPYFYTSSNQGGANPTQATSTVEEPPSIVPDSSTPLLSEEMELAKRYVTDLGQLMTEIEQQTVAMTLSGSTQPEVVFNGVQRKDNHRHAHRLRNERSEGGSSPGWEEDYKAWEAKFRCTNFRTTKKHSAGMASIDSSAPETTSSDNSPTVVRRSTWIRPTGPGSDSGSSGESSDSFASSSSGDKIITRPKLRDTESPPQGMGAPRFSVPFSPAEGLTRTVVANVKMTRAVFKGKRIYPSVPNQPSEASAHFMFELAKTVLTKAGGNSTTAVLFTQPSSSQNHRGPHRGLHMCAFQIGLYALGLHNAVSPNWLSRTYSSQVSWITGQAMEIGSTAINFLIDTWEGHLTPPEVASLADRASRGRDPSMVRAAAELALSCLPHAHALNPNEIQRALIQCKEQSGEMLERACLAVESAAKGGGVYPEVLFDVAKRWHELYEESLQHNGSRNRSLPTNAAIHPEIGMFNGTNSPLLTPPSEVCTSQPPPPLPNQLERSNMVMNAMVGEGLMPNMPPPPQPPQALQVLPQLTCAPLPYGLPPYSHPYSYLPGLAPFLHPSLPFHPANYTYGPHMSHSYYPAAAAVTTAHHMRPQNTTIYSAAPIMGVPMPPGSLGPQARSVLPLTNQPPPANNLAQPTQPQVNGSVPQLNQRQMGYLLSAYRVGMLAMETLARRVHDDRPQAKYARNPPYEEGVKWLLEVAKKLGTSYLQEFCICTVNSVASPFILHDIVMEASHYLARSGTATLSQPLRSHLLTPLVQKCQQMFIACTHFKMYHITSAEYEDFVKIIRSARMAFQMTPGGMVQFNELLQSLRRSKSCKKELWSRIANALAAPAI